MLIYSLILVWFRLKVSKKQKISIEELKAFARRIDYHRSFFSNLLDMVPEQILNGYREYNAALYDSIFDRIDESVIVDSSKYPSRALGLYKAGIVDISCVYVVRHPVSVVRSFGMKGIEQSYKSPVAANIYYWLINMACNLALRRMSGIRYIKIRYEDLIAQPEQTLRNISDALDLDLADVISKIAADDELEVGKLFEGNRIRLKQVIRLRRSSGTPGGFGGHPFTTLANQWWWK